MRLIYKRKVIHILYKRIWFISGLCSLFSQWLAGSAVSLLSCELNGQGSSLAWAIVLATFHFQVNYSYFLGQLGLVGLEFSTLARPGKYY